MSEQKQQEEPKLEKSKKTGFGPASTIFVTLMIYFGSQIIGAILLGVFLSLRGYDLNDVTYRLEQSTAIQFFYVLLVQIFVLLFLWLFIRHRKITLASIGLKKPKLNNLFYALPAFGVYFILLIVVLSIVGVVVPGIDLDQEQQIGFKSVVGFWPLLMVFISLVILPSIVEEILVRGFLYSGLRNKLPKIKAAIIASLIFGAAHLQLGSGAPPLWVAAIDTFILSMILIWLREKTGSLWAGMGVHAIKNSIAFVFLFIVSVS